MAKVTSAFTTYGSTTNREDLSNTIYNIDPTDTPILSSLSGKRSVSARSFDWSVEGLPSVNASNADVEGYALSNATTQAPTRKTNVTQISHRDATVTKSQQASDMAGVGKNFLANRMAMAAKALKRDMETIISGKQARVDGDDSGPTARKTEGIEHAIVTNVSLGTGGAVAASGTAAVTDGTLRTFTQGLLEDTLELCFTNGAEPDTLLVGPYEKRVVSHFSGRGGIQVQVPTDKLVVGFDVYSTDYGLLKVIPSRFSRARTALLLDKRFVKIAYFRDFETYDIATIGSAMTKVIEVEYGVEVSNEKAHGKIADIADIKANDPASPV